MQVRPDRDAWELFDIGWSSSEGGIDTYLGRVIDKCSKWFEADGVTLFLQLENSSTYLLAAQSGIDADLPWSASFQLGESIAGKVAASGQALLVDDPRGHPALRHEGLIVRRNIGTAIVAPLEAPHNGCLGVLNLSRRAGALPFASDDVAGVVQLARQMAMAVANARLFTTLNSTIEKHRRLAAQTATIVESLHVGVLALDSNGRVVEANREALRLLRSRAKGVGLRWEELCAKIPAAARPAVERCVSAAAAGKRKKETVSAAERKHFTIFASPVPDGGVTLVIEDVSKAVESERELARVSRMAEIGQMTAAIAHEIRNPLTSIKGAAQVLREETKIEKARGWAMVIEQETQALNRLCDQFLEFARPLSLNVRQVDLNVLVERLLMLSGPEMEASGVSLRFKPSQKLPIILGDGDKLGQAVRNLIRNAIEALPGGGEIQVSTSADPKGVKVAVTDTGVGISDENLPKLFTPFFTTKPSGTGLGLCNSNRILEAHGGAIQLERHPKGTTFTLEVPRKRKERN